MAKIISSKIHLIGLIACVSSATLLAGCEHGTNTGYYDKNGNYVATDTPFNMRENAHSPMPGGNDNWIEDRENNRSEYPRYNRRGYYNQDGYYIQHNSAINVPNSMFPPRNMCRVWFTERAVADQPPIERCNDINYRVPAGAYVIYGG